VNNPLGNADDLFARALEIPAGPQREAFLGELAARDEATALDIRSLVQAHERAGGFLESRPQGQADQEEAAPKLPGFRIERRLGRGGLGVVYAAWDEKLNRPVAIKVLRGRLEEPSCRRVLDEARKAAALRDPAIITIYSVLDQTAPPAIVMELVEGFSIDRFAAELNFEQKARLLREVARGSRRRTSAGSFIETSSRTM